MRILLFQSFCDTLVSDLELKIYWLFLVGWVGVFLCFFVVVCLLCFVFCFAFCFCNAIAHKASHVRILCFADKAFLIRSCSTGTSPAPA